ncbi:MAG: hypothetical protein MJ052_05205 [Sphaerochaetaceae bacterium]|nr:hypothetical protein [Sphaerochaetaceae bacterium]
MKVAGALKAAVISVATVVTVLVFLFAFGLRPLGIEYLEEVLSSYSSDGRISIETGGMNRHILTSVSVKKLKISFDGKSVVSADEVRLSLGLLDIIKLAKGETSAEIDIILKGSRIDFNDDVKNYFFPEVKFPEGSVQDLIEDAKNYVPENNSETSFSQNGKKTFKEILTDNKFSILVDDASVTYNVKGDSLSALNVDMYVSFDEMLSLKVFNADIPLVSGYLNLFGSSGSVRDIRFSSDGSGRAYYSVSGIEFPGKVKIGQVMGNADMADMLVSLTFEMSSLELKDTDLKRGLSGAGVSAVINGDLTQKRFWGRLKAGSMIADDPGFLELDYLQAYDSSIYFSYGGDGRITTEADVSVSGYSKLSYIGDFSLTSTFRMTLEKNDEASGFTVSAFTGRMDNITAAVLPGRNSVRGSYADDRIRLYFNLNGEVFGEFDYSLDTSDSELRMNFSDFSIYSHRKALLKFADKIENFADKETLLSGNLFAKGRFKKENPNGRISLNLATGNVIFKDERQAAAATLEIAISGKTAEVDTLALTAFGYRLSYSGTVDIEKIFPKGKLVLSEAQTGLSVFDMYFSADESLRTYEFEGGLKDHEKLKVSGFVNFSDAYNIVAETTLSTLYGIYQFRLSFNRIDGTFGLKSDRIVMEVSGLFEGKPVFHGWLNDFTIKLNENMNLVFDSDISGFYDFSSKIYSINFKDFLIRISDILSLEFNMLFEKNHINIKGLLINIRSESVKFGGNADFRFDSLEDILKGNTSSLSAEVDFKASESSDFIKANFTENNYSFELATSYRLPVKISLLGRRDNGFYAECSAGDVLFDARFKSRVLRFFNGRGNASTVDFSSFDSVG